MIGGTDPGEFLTTLQEQVEAYTRGSEEGESNAFLEEAFTALCIEHLIETGELEDGEAAHYEGQNNRLKASGYAIHEEEGRLDLLVTLYRQASVPETVSRAEVEVALRKAQSFLRKALEGLHQRLDATSQAHQMAERIYIMRDRLQRVRLFLLTDGVTTLDTLPETVQDSIQFSYHLWDLERLFRSMTSGYRREPITIDLQSRYGQAIPCLELPGGALDYHACLAIFPGSVLAGIYRDHGARLLERNVRSFLQIRGGINRSIRETLQNAPHRFLAYNNGISATAARVDYVTLPDGRRAISRLHDLQIVNGGQTTASLYTVMVRDRLDLSQVQVQAKITIVDRERMEEMVPLISRYANSQNKVSDADFSANDQFHVQVEEYSRTVWAPAVGAAQRQTHWFYERARGQYADARSRAKLLGRREERMFLEGNPKEQSFTKTELARYFNTFEQLPHIVSRGAQKNFNEFTLRHAERETGPVDRQYFQRLLALAILFRRAEKVVQEGHYGGYRANDVTYTLAYLSRHTGRRMDLDRIWRDQDITAATVETIREVSSRVHAVVIDAPDGGNVTEWCKKEACWRRIENLRLELSPSFLQELTVGPCIPEPMGETPDGAPLAETEANEAPVSAIMSLRAGLWSDLNQWLVREGWGNGHKPLVLKLAHFASRRRSPDEELTRRGLDLLEKARRAGFHG